MRDPWRLGQFVEGPLFLMLACWAVGTAAAVGGGGAPDALVFARPVAMLAGRAVRAPTAVGRGVAELTMVQFGSVLMFAMKTVGASGSKGTGTAMFANGFGSGRQQHGQKENSANSEEDFGASARNRLEIWLPDHIHLLRDGGQIKVRGRQRG